MKPSPLGTMHRNAPHCRWIALLVGAILCLVTFSGAYSVLTHEQVIDLLWKDSIVPLLKERFPRATEEELREAHAYCYGGSLIQDMGYYPFGSKFFSDLTHYVRSGDFVLSLLHNSEDLNDYAFALGALAHYSADNIGHPVINSAVALEYPKLRRKFGDRVTYNDSPTAHIRTEFGFDMTQVAKNRYTSDRYRDFIGFKIAKPLLEKSFLETYGLELKDVIPNEDLAIGSFRRSISTIIPEMTRVALLSRKKAMIAETPNFDAKKFRYYLSRAQYEHEWGKGYRRPGIGTRIFAFFLKIVPKVGPFKAVDFKIPTQKTEDSYIASVNDTIENYKTLLHRAGQKQLDLSNTDFDTGKLTKPGEYALTDKTYARLLEHLEKHDFENTSTELRRTVLAFYADVSAPIATKRNPEDWQKTQKRLERLRATVQKSAVSSQVSE
jgi:Zinc dependent phospholipase C